MMKMIIILPVICSILLTSCFLIGPQIVFEATCTTGTMNIWANEGCLGGEINLFGVSSPWSHSFLGTSGEWPDLSATNNQASGDVSVIIKLNGMVWKKGNCSGGDCTAACGGQLP
jgi:hypothetical protein